MTYIKDIKVFNFNLNNKLSRLILTFILIIYGMAKIKKKNRSFL